MRTNLMPSIHSLLTDPDHPDRDTLVTMIAPPQATTVLACLAPTDTLAQITAVLRSG